MNKRQIRERIVQYLFAKSINTDTIIDDEDLDLIDTIENVLCKVTDIDDIISSNLYNWNITRLALVDLAIIRYATYELKYTDTPKEIIINEAIILTKRFSDIGDGKAKGFNNKVLDNISAFLESK